ncbi:hypothetical protein FNAPI_1058 [Fusarium napiforme]|uniref:Uncharacterized protein n=1 Tax=Fusarium napiforme TaxID=42672 RepID=A0A8H5K619_9HYPO|nr:hypothetical protein FNAPI_1058 [Fusarium napiforme]
MSGASLPGERFSLVASFYGPGNIALWLCMVISVLTTWCLNAEYRRKDSISADLVAVLAVPGVAAGHAIYMLFFGGLNYESIVHLFTSADSEVVKHAAAAEAALDVCETFSAIALLLVFVSMFYGHLRRTLAVVAVGLLAFSTETVVFTQRRGVSVPDTNLTRPFIFNFFVVMVSLVVFVAVWLTAFSCLIMWLRLGVVEEPEEQIEMGSADIELEIEVGAALRGQAMDVDSAVRWENQQQSAMALQLAEEEARDEGPMRYLTLLSIFFLPFSFFATLASTSTPFGVLEKPASYHRRARVLPSCSSFQGPRLILQNWTRWCRSVLASSPFCSDFGTRSYLERRKSRGHGKRPGSKQHTIGGPGAKDG